jgi:hypothetical protein
MRGLQGLAGCALLLSLAVSPAGAQELWTQLNGTSEVPPNDSLASGSGTFLYDDGTGLLQYTVNYDGIGTLTEAHLHGPVDPADPNATGPLLFVLDAGDPLHGTVGPLTLQQGADLLADRWYINIHSLAYPTGEIRGRIMSRFSVEPRTWTAVKSLYAR